MINMMLLQGKVFDNYVANIFRKISCLRQILIHCICNSSLFNQLWKTEAAETGLYSRILRVFQNSLPPDVINICILMLYQCGRALEVRLSEIRRRISK